MQIHPDLRPILELARRTHSEEDEIERFFEDLRVNLARRQLAHGGRTLALAEYLDARERESARRGAGDEQPIVAEVVRGLLLTLGYRPGDFRYNEPLSGSGERSVPDFIVSVPELFGTVPVFIVECKSTSVALLDGAAGAAAGGGESPLAQLRRYVLSGVVHGRVGLLTNGRLLEAWELASGGDTRLLRLDLHALARCALNGDPFAADQSGALRTLWLRFARSAFIRDREIRQRASDVEPLPPRRIEEIRDAFAATGRPRTLENALTGYYEETWGAKAIDVSTAPELLVDSLRGLIEQFAEDVRQQLEEALRRFEDYEIAAAELERRSRLPRLRQPLELWQPSFELTTEEFRDLLLDPLDAWCRRPRLEDMGEQIERWVDALDPHVKLGAASPGDEQLSLAGAQRPAVRSTRGDNGKKRVLAGLRHALDAFCRQALEEHAERRWQEEEYAASRRVGEAYRSWAARVSSSVLVGAPEATFRREFALQTAYVYIVRLLLVRICEDKGLFQRKLSDGGLILWQERASRYLDYAAGRSYEYLTRMAYECAQNVYVHFYGASELFDWYRMDEKMLLRALLVLDVFNLAAIDRDIIGAVYGRYLEEGKHEQGRYYTPRALVTTMLDRLGYRGEATLGRRLGDLACGSGSFLVEACRRLLEPFRGADGRIPTERLAPALAEVQANLYGVEINPFACYLAETNLLIQVLDLIRQAQRDGVLLTVERFQIYSGDALLVDERLTGASETTVYLLGRDRATVELLKARTGPFASGFDFLVGNPPYVRADEEAPSYLAYRRALEGQSWFTTQHLKWDLYVPFVEQYHRLLADRPEARCCLVTIESISTAPYAEKVRRLLARQAVLHEVLFTRGLRLFEDARWQDNVVVCFSRGEPAAGHRVRRTVAASRETDGALAAEALDEPEQLAADPDTLLRLRPPVELDRSGTVPWGEICYVSKGMVLHSHEKLEEGEIVLVPPSYDPETFGEELIEDLDEKGKRIRHRRFRRDDLLADRKDHVHQLPYLDPRELRRGGTGHVRWVEYGPHTRCPSRVSRPTFPELYDRPKILFGTFSGIAVDGGDVEGFLAVSHSMTLAILWHRLEDVENRALKAARRALEEQEGFDPTLSQDFSEWYLCALALSEPIQGWLHANKRSMKEHVYPDDVKAIPVKRISRERQAPFIRLERERHRLWRELTALEAEGFRLGERVRVPVHRLAERFRTGHPEIEHLELGRMPASIFTLVGGFYHRDLRRARATGAEIRVGRETAARVGDGVEAKTAVAELLARYLRALPGTFADRQATDALPRNETGLLALAAYLEEQEDGVRRRQRRIAEIQQEIDRLAWELYG